MEKEIETFYPESRQAWRAWLLDKHDKAGSVWIIYYKKNAGNRSISYGDAVDEALCFGWIDSKSKPIDNEKYMQFFCKRKPKGTWSKVNKDKVERLIAQGFMTKAGFDTIEAAKANGSWTILDEVEALFIPPDLDDVLEQKPEAKTYFLNLSRSDKRNMLQWLVLAKRPETRQNRIQEIVELARQGQKPKQFR